MRERFSGARYTTVLAARFILDCMFVLPLTIMAAVARFLPKKIEIGMGPTPIINSVYHKQALAKYGHQAEIFVDTLWYYSFGYDYAPKALLSGLPRVFAPYWLMARAIFRYRTLYTYFDGGPLRSSWGEAPRPRARRRNTLRTSRPHRSSRCPDRRAFGPRGWP